MQFDARLAGDAATLARAHREMLARLPATVHAFILVELQKWPTLFAPEQRYQRALLDHLSALTRPDLQQAVAGIARVEAEAGCHQDRARQSRPVPGRRAGAAAKTAAPAGVAEGSRWLLPDKSTPRSTHGSTPRMRPVDWSSRSTAAASPSRQTSCGAASRGPAFECLYAGGHAGIRSISQGAPWRARQWRHGAGAVCGSHGSAQLAPLDAWIIESHEALHDLCDGASGKFSSQA